MSQQDGGMETPITQEATSVDKDLNSVSADVVNTPVAEPIATEQTNTEPVQEEEVYDDAKMKGLILGAVDNYLIMQGYTPEQIKELERQVIEEGATTDKQEPIAEVANETDERVPFIKENAMLKAHVNDLQAQLDAANQLLTEKGKTEQELRNRGVVLADTERQLIETKRLAEDEQNKDNSYLQRQYELLLKAELEKRWGISLNAVEQQAYLRKGNQISDVSMPAVDMQKKIAEAKQEAIRKAMATSRR